ncbi:MAG: translational GTPase TypA [Candidatus Paceibacterota bacterium]
MEIRNIAIIAHVDHGKTTLTDALMKQNGGLQDEGISMDSNALEKERGITIYSKNTSIYYKDTKINIVDTPGHADFGSEVERVLRATDSVLLLVDAVEGPMPQTRFVLKKSLELDLKPIVVINKIDKPAADPHRVHDEILELFFELGASEEQANFETVYAIGRDGVALKKLEDTSSNLSPLLDVILEKVPNASKCQRLSLTKNMSKRVFDTRKMSAQVFNLGYDDFLGRLAVARIYSGTLDSSQSVFIKGENGTRKGKITKLFTFEGIHRKEVSSASCGDIVLLAGIPDIYIGETLSEEEDMEPLPHITIDEPTLSLNFLVNNSPLAGREGKFITSRQIKERLEKELEINVGLKVDFTPDQEGKLDTSFFRVYGRGELHIAILLENMRREGFELQVSQPEVIIKEKDGVKTEPYEELMIDVPMEFSGSVIEKINKRRGLMKDMVEKEGIARVVFDIPTRGLLGYRGEFIIDTKGEGIMSSRVTGFREYAGEIKKREYGSMVSMTSGKAVAFSLANLQERGILYIKHGTEVYEGMVIGNVLKGDELSVNPTKGKQLTNMRASGTDEAITLNPAFTLSIERGLEVMNEDEYLEITPKDVRLRKQNYLK